jgi:hypothetical protein
LQNGEEGGAFVSYSVDYLFAIGEGSTPDVVWSILSNKTSSYNNQQTE